jgi:hypothetical protein
MKFVHPEILYALSAVAIPILVHLFNFRRFKKVLFPNIAFLKEVKLQTQSKSKLKHYLILAARILAITCIVFAFARPFIPNAEIGHSGAEQTVSVYVNNGFGMDLEGPEGRLLNSARNKAFEVISGFSPTDRFLVLTNDFEGRDQRTVSKEEAVDRLAAIETSGRSRSLPEIIRRQADAMQKAEGLKHMFIVSDFRQSNLGDWRLPEDSMLRVYLVPTAPVAPANLSVDSAWFDNPVHQLGQQEKLSVRITNHSDGNVSDVPMALSVNGEQKAFGTFSVSAGDRVDTALFFSNTESGWKRVSISIDDNPVRFDNDYHLSYRVAERGRVLIVSDSGRDKYAADVFATDEFYTIEQSPAGAVDFGRLNEFDLIVLSGLTSISSGMVSEMEKAVGNGISLVLFPPKSKASDLNPLLEAIGSAPFGSAESSENRAREINTAHPLFKALFENVPANPNLPVAKQWFTRQKRTMSRETPLLIQQNGEWMLSVTEFGEGRAYIFNTALDPEVGNLPNHALFPAILLRIGETSSVLPDGAFTLGKDANVLLRNVRISGDQTLRLRHPESGLEVIPEHRQTMSGTRVYVPAELNMAGHYDFLLDGNKIYGAGFNFDRAESHTRFSKPEDIKRMLTEAGALNVSILDGTGDYLREQLTQARDGRTFWRMFIIWALIFLAVETLLIKFWK